MIDGSEKRKGQLVFELQSLFMKSAVNGELVFLLSVQKLLFIQDFRSILLQKTHFGVFSVVFPQD